MSTDDNKEEEKKDEEKFLTNSPGAYTRTENIEYE